MGEWGAADWAAFGAVGALVVYVVLGVTGIVQLREARKVRELRNRPYVIVDFEFKSIFVYLVIKNIGSTPARDVKIDFDKPLQIPNHDSRNNDFNIFQSAIPMIPPGRVIRVSFGAGPDFFQEEAVKVPLNYAATLRYTDLSGGRKYDDPPLLLDLRPYKYTIIGSDHMADLVAAIKDLRQTVKGWTSAGNLQVRTLDQHAADRRTGRTNYRYQARQMLSSGGARGLVRWQAQRWRRRLGL